jgi:predicted CXXCH cytochrome family protein
MRTKALNGGIMKRILQVGLILAVGLVYGATAWAYTGSYTPGTGINETPHDLPRGDNGMAYTPVPADSLQRVCIYCHAPHNTYRLNSASGVGVGPVALDVYDYLPLWNHTLPTLLPAYTMYDNGPGAPQTGPRSSQARANGMEPGSVSLLCLSCHDGSIAVNSYGNSAQLSTSQSNGTSYIVDAYGIGKNGAYLGNHHPIGFDYPSVATADPGDGFAGGLGGLRQGGIRDMALTNFYGTTETIQSHLFANSRIGSQNSVECATCHSVHNIGNGGETLLWISDRNSNLCLTCHDKGAPLP